MAKIRPKERSAEEKTAIVLSLLRGDATAAELCRRHGVSEDTLGKWRERFLNAGEAALAGGRTKDIPTSLLEHENQALKDALAESVLRHELFKKPAGCHELHRARSAPRRDGVGRQRLFTLLGGFQEQLLPAKAARR